VNNLKLFPLTVPKGNDENLKPKIKIRGEV
jgi:hypothetical protein